MISLNQFLANRARAYRIKFGGRPLAVETRIVLEDLAKFCRAAETCVVPGDRDKSLLLEGRREVWLRIQQHLHLTDEELMVLYKGNTAQGN